MSEAERLGRHQSHQERPGQTGPIRHGHRVEFRQLDLGLSQGVVNHRQNPLDVCPTGDFRHDAAEAPVQIVLRRDHGSQHVEFVGHHRRGRLVAGRLDRKNANHGELTTSLLLCGTTLPGSCK